MEINYNYATSLTALKASPCWRRPNWALVRGYDYPRPSRWPGAPEAAKGPAPGASRPRARSDDTADVIAQRLALYHRVTAPIICWYRDRGILVSVDAMRPAQQVGREILTALDAMRPLLDSQAARAQNPGDLATLAKAFGATGPALTPPGELAAHRWPGTILTIEAARTCHVGAVETWASVCPNGGAP